MWNIYLFIIIIVVVFVLLLNNTYNLYKIRLFNDIFTG